MSKPSGEPLLRAERWPSWKKSWREWKAASFRSSRRSPRTSAALELARFCQQQLEAAQQQVKVLEGEVLKPLADVGTGGTR